LDATFGFLAHITHNQLEKCHQTAHRTAYTALLETGYRVHWTDLRMTLDGHDEVVPADGGIVFSNWEI
jgi:hypothetical protein